MIKEIFGKKIGMTQIFDEAGDLIGVTLVEVEPACVLEKIDHPKGAKAKIGCFKVQEKNKLTKPIMGYFKKLGVSPYKLVQEVEIAGELEPKKEIGIEKNWNWSNQMVTRFYYYLLFKVPYPIKRHRLLMSRLTAIF